MRTWQVSDVMTAEVAAVGEETPYREIVDLLIRRGISAVPVVDGFRRASLPAAARLMDREQVKRLPVLDDLGRLVGIVTRSDLLRVHLRQDAEIREDVVQEVLRRVLAVQDGLVTVRVRHGEVTLDGRVDRRSSADLAVRLAGQVSGVTRVNSTLGYEQDDTVVLEQEAGITPVA
ncbi:CBS domain-containing protein [Micromonospora inyonensis]|uniref:CBS domain-containing protein n=1 Tax=Micromonospora inyonensis TaxID=47866 RepID=A0A1C6SE42_9ACTN|nr:CBS domain-containing protein [Micromonospora inyonensis]SCL27589.1 CBS domain-containing protein [Micromonospora inyonensis]